MGGRFRPPTDRVSQSFAGAVVLCLIALLVRGPLGRSALRYPFFLQNSFVDHACSSSEGLRSFGCRLRRLACCRAYRHPSRSNSMQQQEPVPSGSADRTNRSFPPTIKPHIVPFLTGWTARRACQPSCARNAIAKRIRNNNSNNNNSYSSSSSSSSSNGDCGCNHASAWKVPSLPTTALLVLLDNRQIGVNVTTASGDNVTVNADNLYRSDHLSLLPDISAVGRPFYTLRYEHRILSLESAIPIASGQTTPETTARFYPTRQTLRFSGINYRSYASMNGSTLQPIVAKPQHPDSPAVTDGMFQRRSYDVTSGGTFAIVVEPPLHPGRSVSSSSVRQQGGDHSMAQDGPVPQFVQGWDWIQPIPDRSTGFYGPVHLHRSGPVAILDPCVHTVHIDIEHDVIRFRVMARLEIIGTVQERDAMLTVESDWGETWKWDIDLSDMTDSVRILDVSFDDVLVQSVQSKAIKLWYPHDMASGPHLYRFRFRFEVDCSRDLDPSAHLRDNVTRNDPATVKNSCKYISDLNDIDVGVRTVSTYLDEHTQGQAFVINGDTANARSVPRASVPTDFQNNTIYIIGGNWVTTDATFRFSASHERYCTELLIHREAGLNLVRVWGGGVSEATPFYECADRLGMLVFQEFWMTGDNNGRWAGNYSWPLNHGVYLNTVEDTVLRLRRHPSLLLYCGCNECLPPSKHGKGSEESFNPPLDIHRGIQDLLAEHDPGRFYIPSSMGGKNAADKDGDGSPWWQNRTYSLAFADGPYGMLFADTFYERNPGLPFDNISIGFQPEIGSASFPTCHGLSTFLTKKEIESGIPHGPNRPARDMWSYHMYEPWSTSFDCDLSSMHQSVGAGTGDETCKEYDHIYAYFHPSRSQRDTQRLSIEQWCNAAQLASHAQYQHLINGFLSHMFEYTTAVIVWKTQSPWPSFRGFMYDWYTLEPNGMYRGIRSAANAGSFSALLDLNTWQVKLVYRQWRMVGGTKPIVHVAYEWHHIDGSLVENGATTMKVADLPGRVVQVVDWQNSNSDILSWPANCSQVCFLLLQVQDDARQNGSAGRNESFSQWYWLTDPDHGPDSDYSMLSDGEWGLNIVEHIVLDARHCEFDEIALNMDVDVAVSSEAPAVLLYPTFSLWVNTDGHRLMLSPIFDADDTNGIVQTPNARRTHRLTVPMRKEWNVPVSEFNITLELGGFNVDNIASLDNVKCRRIGRF